LNTSVAEILIENGKASGIKLENGKTKQYNIVVSNSDVSFTYKHLLKNKFPKEKLLSSESSTSAVVFNWGISREFEELGLHNIFFSENYQKEFQQIFEENKIPDDPTIYLYIGSKEVKSDAPKGKESWFVMINAPAGNNYDEEQLIAVTRKIVITKLEKALNTSIESLIEAEMVIHPNEIEKRTFSSGGALYGPASNTRWSAFQRQANKSKDVQGLFFVGGSVHPGGGIPLCLSSAKITAEIIESQYGKK
jgi:phytoene dehydrogenase-like protein